MKPEDITLEMLERATGLKVSEWDGKCTLIAREAGRMLFNGVPVYGHYTGNVDLDGYWGDRQYGFIQHSWVHIGKGRVLDPTRFSFENVEPYIFIGEGTDYDEGGNKFRSKMHGQMPDFDHSAKSHWLKCGGMDDARFQKITLIGGWDKLDVSLSKGIRMSINQLFWLANRPYDELQPVALPIYKMLEDLGMIGLVPIDNRRRAEREAT